MLIQKFNENYKQCECPECFNVNQIFGDQMEKSEEMEIQNDGATMKQVPQLCRKKVFEAFGGVVKKILQSDVQNVHVQRCLGKYLDYDELREMSEDEFARMVSNCGNK